MRQGQNSRRNRGRGGRRPQGGSQGGGSRRTYDSNGPDVKVRGTPSQIYEKYQVLAREAYVSGNRIAAENYLQHAEHYYRISAENGADASGRSSQTQNRAAPQPRPETSSAQPASQPAPSPQPVLANGATADGAAIDGDGADASPAEANATKTVDGRKAAPASEPPAVDDGVRKTVTRRRRKPAAEATATKETADSAGD